MCEKGVTEVVQQGRGQGLVAVLLAERQSLAHQVGHVIRAKRMLETGVVGAWEDQMGQAELLHPVQALHLRAVQNLQEGAVDLDAAVHAVVDYLLPGHEKK